jgi:hypothetical protein
MKKSLLITAVICFSLFTANAQLSGTRWQTTIQIPMQNGPQPFQTTWDFQKDTLTVTYDGGKLPTDVMTYSEEKSIVSIKKVSGGVPCGSDEVGKFSYEIKNDQLLIRKLEDACQVRGAVDISQPFSRVK